jgi:hypothetical protein
MVERVHRQLKDALRVRGAGPAWHSHLPWVLLGLRAAPRRFCSVFSGAGYWDTTGSSWIAPARARSSTCGRATASHEAAALAAAANTQPAHLVRAEHVYVRVGGQQKQLAAPFAGPYLVVSKGVKTFTIQVGQRQEIVSVDWLKPHTGLGPVSPAMAVSCGHPPRMPATPSVQPASS